MLRSSRAVRSCILFACLAVLTPLRHGHAQEKAAGGAAGAGGTAGSGGAAGTPEDAHPPGAPATIQKVEIGYKVTPTEAVRGSTVTLKGKNFPENREETILWLDDFDVGHPAFVSKERDSLAFVVPDEGRLGETVRTLSARSYVLRFSTKTEGETDAGPRVTVGILRITPEKVPPLKLEGIKPTIVYPSTTPIVLVGDGFGGRLRDYSLLVDGTELQLCAAEEPLCNEMVREGPDPCCKGLQARFVSDHQLEIERPFKDASGRPLSGDHLLGLRAGDKTTDALKVAFSPYDSSKIRWIALLATAIVLSGMVGLVALGGRRHRVGSRMFVDKAFLIDTETDTYSLSKFQFYAWSVAALLTYSYLTLSRCLVQGRVDIADVPANLPSILGISAGAAVLSTGVAKVRGPKAAGVLHPSFTDLLTSGGVVSPERFQFLLWTVVAIATFILSVWNVDPTVLNDLPKIPDGLVALSGLSAAAYLGGKIARGPGPVIDEVVEAPEKTTSPTPPNVATSPDRTRLLVLGRNLGIDSTFEVKGQSITELFDPNDHKDRRPIVMTREDGEDDLRFAKSLKLILKSLPDEWKRELEEPEDPARPLVLTIANRDGQRADAEVQRKLLQKPP